VTAARDLGRIHGGLAAARYESCREVSVASTAVMISVNCGGRERALPAVPDPLREFGQLMRRYGDASDVTITIELPDGHGQLLMALEAGSVFVGLVASDGIYQYVVADEQAEGKCQFIIGSAATFIDTRYVLQVTAAIDLVTPWVAGASPHFRARMGTALISREKAADTKFLFCRIRIV
jgi:hypothetical protein